jgi:protease I
MVGTIDIPNRGGFFMEEGKRVAMIVHDYFEQVEMTDVRQLLEAEDIEVDLIAPNLDEVHGLHHVELGDDFSVDKTLDEVEPTDYDAVVLPGGVVNADQLRMSDEARLFVQDMANASKPIAAICHAPWLLISAGLIDGHTVTSYPTLQDDVRNAGGIWVDKEVVIDDNIITSRNPGDIPAFSRAIIDALHEL